MYDDDQDNYGDDFNDELGYDDENEAYEYNDDNNNNDYGIG